MSTLREIFYTIPKISDKWDRYFDVYDRHFQKFKGENITFIEVGVQNGGSLEMWSRYFGPESKMYILALLYREVTLRDDYQLLIVSLIKNTEADVSKNYIVVNKQSVLTLIINQYKTSNKFGQIVIKLSPLLSRKIRKFIIMEGLICDDNNYLFGDTNLTSYVSKSNAEIGIEGSISLYRKMRISDLLATNPSAEQRHQLAFDMKHSSNIQKTYFRCNIGQDD